MGGGAWTFLVRGVICLVNSDNERDSNFLTRCRQGYSVEALHTLVLYIYMIEWVAIFHLLYMYMSS